MLQDENIRLKKSQCLVDQDSLETKHHDKQNVRLRKCNIQAPDNTGDCRHIGDTTLRLHILVLQSV